MGRLIAVSNRVATPTETKGSPGGLAVGIYSALKDMAVVKYGGVPVQPGSPENWKAICKMGGLK